MVGFTLYYKLIFILLFYIHMFSRSVLLKFIFIKLIKKNGSKFIKTKCFEYELIDKLYYKLIFILIFIFLVDQFNYNLFF